MYREVVSDLLCVFICGGFDSHRLRTVVRFDSLQASGVAVAQPTEVMVWPETVTTNKSI